MSDVTMCVVSTQEYCVVKKTLIPYLTKFTEKVKIYSILGFFCFFPWIWNLNGLRVSRIKMPTKKLHVTLAHIELSDILYSFHEIKLYEYYSTDSLYYREHLVNIVSGRCCDITVDSTTPAP